ncbi:hypothetical protein EG329_013297 [Mollisiaceae sp. DMI_Dod_QoI]|nr:hypothetical protein EG329_013297 [Helotiales sp. DMI_Dod_QoI]
MSSSEAIHLDETHSGEIKRAHSEPELGNHNSVLRMGESSAGAMIKDNNATLASEDAASGSASKDPTLKGLPFEIRTQILEELLVRPVGLAPGPISYTRKDSNDNVIHVECYNYQWEGHPLRSFAAFQLRDGKGSSRKLNISWETEPTECQLAEIKAGTFDESWKYDEQGKTWFKKYVLPRGEFSVKIVNRGYVCLEGIQANILQVCKEFHMQGTPLLYGQNTFAFDHRGELPGATRSEYGENIFDKLPIQVPGLPQRYGGPHTKQEVQDAINAIFDHEKKEDQPFIARDLLSQFFLQIGRKNASLITSVMLLGRFRRINNEYIGWARILPIESTILKNVCHHLKKLTIQQVEGKLQEWEWLPPDRSGITDEERVDQAIGKLVENLPSLEELQLGQYLRKPVKPTIMQEWGKSLRWEVFVKDRSLQRALAESQTATALDGIGTLGLN